MTPRRFATLAAALCGSVVLAGSVVAGLDGAASIEPTVRTPKENLLATSIHVYVGPVSAAQTTEVDKTDVAGAPVAKAASDPAEAAVVPAAVMQVAVAPVAVSVAEPAVAPVAVSAAEPAVAPAAISAPEPAIVEAALPEPKQALPDETQPEEEETAGTPDPVQNDTKVALSASIEIFDECLQADVCIDRFLWALYQRTPKRDTVKHHERRKVTVKKKGKTVTVTKTVTKLVDEDFTWKDPKAAERVGMSMPDYVIGGMERSFKMKLFYALRAADEAGLEPGITSAFRDDYRQSIASGMKAATDRSFHGGSTRGGYGHGLAADVVSVKGTSRAKRWVSTEIFWKWIDTNAKEYGIGRPYGDRDPPHVAPTDGREYAAHRGGSKSKHAKADAKKRNRVAAAKRPNTTKIIAEQSPVSRAKGTTQKHRRASL
jgi:hypothetical protein